MLRALSTGAAGHRTNQEAVDVIGKGNFADLLSKSSCPRKASRWPFQSAGKAVRPEAVEAAWKEYRATGSPEARETLMQRYIPRVRFVAERRVRRPSRRGRRLPGRARHVR